MLPKPEVTDPEFTIPTDVSEEVTTVEFNTVPVNVPAAAVTVMFAEPLFGTPATIVIG